jgi:hypothetical protein
MYLARHVGGWSFPKISRFYNNRHYTTVMAAIRKIERLRSEDESTDALVEMPIARLSPETSLRSAEVARSKWHRLIIDAVSEQVIKLTDPATRENRIPDQQPRDPARTASIDDICGCDVIGLSPGKSEVGSTRSGDGFPRSESIPRRESDFTPERYAPRVRSERRPAG